MRIKQLVEIAKQFQNRALDQSRARLIKAYLESRNKPNAVFIWIPKTAGHSLFSILSIPMLLNLQDIKYRFPNRGGVTFGHIDYAQLVSKRYISSYFDKSAYKFAITRNPYARAVSLYFYLIVKQEGANAQSFNEFCKRLINEKLPPIGLYNVMGLSQCNPQIRWIEKVRLDYVGRVETLDISVKQISDHMGCSGCQVPILNSTNHEDFKKYYCAETKQIVEELYKEDFEAFNYAYEKW